MSKKRRGKRLLVIAVIVVIVLGLIAFLLVRHADRIIKGELERRLGKTFSVEKIEIKWGAVEAAGIKLTNREGRDTVKMESLSARADFMRILKREYVISSLTIKRPYVFIEVDRNGKVVSPVAPEIKAFFLPLALTRLRIEKGEVDYLDRKTARTPVLTRVREIDLDVRDMTLPPSDGVTKYELSAHVMGAQGTGTVRSSGKINLETADTECKGEARHLDITSFKPYFRKDTNVDIIKGFLDVDMDVKVASRKLHAPGRAVLKDLEFENRPGIKNRFMGAPLSLVVASLKREGNRIPIDFSVTGDLDNPKMNITEDFMNDLAHGLAGKLGLSIKGMGQSMVDAGAAGIKGLGAGAKGVKRVFKK